MLQRTTFKVRAIDAIHKGYYKTGMSLLIQDSDKADQEFLSLIQQKVPIKKSFFQ